MLRDLDTAPQVPLERRKCNPVNLASRPRQQIIASQIDARAQANTYNLKVALKLSQSHPREATLHPPPSPSCVSEEK